MPYPAVCRNHTWLQGAWRLHACARVPVKYKYIPSLLYVECPTHLHSRSQATSIARPEPDEVFGPSILTACHICSQATFFSTAGMHYRHFPVVIVSNPDDLDYQTLDSMSFHHSQTWFQPRRDCCTACDSLIRAYAKNRGHTKDINRSSDDNNTWTLDHISTDASSDICIPPTRQCCSTYHDFIEHVNNRGNIKDDTQLTIVLPYDGGFRTMDDTSTDVSFHLRLEATENCCCSSCTELVRDIIRAERWVEQRAEQRAEHDDTRILLPPPLAFYYILRLFFLLLVDLVGWLVPALRVDTLDAHLRLSYAIGSGGKTS